MTLSLVEPVETDVRQEFLGDHVEILSGFAFDASKFSERGQLPVVRIRDVVRGHSVTRYTGDFDERFILADGDLLVGMDGEFNRGTWRGGRALLNQRVCKMAPNNSSLDARYLYHFLPMALTAIEAVTPFATVKHLSVKSIREIVIPLPPLPEQRRIAAILDQADELRTQRRKALALLEDLIDAAFAALYGAGGAGKFQSVSLGELADVQTGPFGSLLHTTDYVSGGVPLVNPMHIKKGQIVPDLEFSISDSKFEELHRFALQSGDVVLGRRGEMGRAAEVLGSHGRLICGTGSMVVRPKQGKATGAVLARLLSSPSARRQLEKAAQGVTMLNLNQSIVASVRVSVPDYAEQHAFAQTRDSLDAQKERLKSHLAHLDELFASLQHRAFRGEL